MRRHNRSHRTATTSPKKVWEIRPSLVYLSALERVYNARLSFLRERELCLGNFAATTPLWNSSLLSLSLSLFLAECGRGGKAIFNAGRELSCRGSLYLLDRSSFFAPLSAHSWRIQ